jgi:ElaB/YqjD/DUF883 family membrane-anchored ribosome-binding protein
MIAEDILRELRKAQKDAARKNTRSAQSKAKEMEDRADQYLADHPEEKQTNLFSFSLGEK